VTPQEALPLLEELRREHGLGEAHHTELQHMTARALTGLARIPEALGKYKELLRLDPDNKAIADDWRRVRAVANKLSEGSDAIMVRNYAKARALYAEGMQVEPDNDCLAALLLSHRAKAFQKQREEAIECEKLLTDAQKEVDEAQAALLAAQRRLIKVPLSPLRSAG
jgi:tetratricopeptide (TPR) repeat protein